MPAVIAAWSTPDAPTYHSIDVHHQRPRSIVAMAKSSNANQARKGKARR